MRVLTGIQSSGKPHLGNNIGAVLPALADGQQSGNPAFYFIADLHSLTTSREGALRRENTSSVAAAWLAFGCDPNKDVLYRQSRVPAVTELTWYLSCFTPYGLLARAHSFKDKSSNLSDVNAGLFIYPVLMAADILPIRRRAFLSEKTRNSTSRSPAISRRFSTTTTARPLSCPSRSSGKRS
ncbi:tryptophanyl-tRNA synthetase [Bradyrhizobium sp. RT11b]